MLREIVLLATLSCTGTASFAQSPECDPSLFRDIYQGTLDQRKSVRVLELIKRDNYEEAKRAMGGDAAFPVEGVPVKFGATYDEFDANRSSYYSRNQIERNERLARSTFENEWSTTSGSAYQACLDASTSIGVHVRAKEVRPTGGNIRLRYENPPGATQPLRLKVTMMFNDRASTRTVETYVLESNSAYTLPFTKEAGDALSMTFNGGGYDIRPLYFPPPPTEISAESQFSSLGLGNCRMRDGGNGDPRVHANLSRDQCLELCADNESCRGVEFGWSMHGNLKCEVFFEDPWRAVPNPRASLECMVKR